MPPRCPPLRHTARAIAGALLVLITGVASADELVFQNGDRLTGTVLKLAEGKVTINSAVAGEVTVPVAQIQSFSTEHPVRVVLPDRTIVEQPVVPGAAGHVKIGGADYALADIRAINPPAVRWTGKAAFGLTLTQARSVRTGFPRLHAGRRPEVVEDRHNRSAVERFQKEDSRCH
jgi:hypothetical protein